MHQDEKGILTPPELEKNSSKAYIQFNKALDERSWTTARGIIEGLLSDSTSSRISKDNDVYEEAHFINYCMDSARISAGAMIGGDGKDFLGLVNAFSELSPDLQPFIKLNPQPARSSDLSENRIQFWKGIETEFLSLLDSGDPSDLEKPWASIVATGLVDKSYINNLPGLKTRLLTQYNNAVESKDASTTQELTGILTRLGLELPSQDTPAPPEAPASST